MATVARGEDLVATLQAARLSLHLPTTSSSSLENIAAFRVARCLGLAMEGREGQGARGVAALRATGLPGRVVDQVEDWVWAAWDSTGSDSEASEAGMESEDSETDESEEEDEVEEDSEEEDEEVMED